MRKRFRVSSDFEKLMKSGGDDVKGVILRGAWNRLLPYMTNVGSGMAGKLVGGSARFIPGIGEAQAQRAEGIAREATKVGMLFSANINDVRKTATNCVSEMRKLKAYTGPFASGGKGGLLRSGAVLSTGNEVIASKRNQIMGNARAGMYGVAAGLVERLPNLVDTVHETGEAARKSGWEPAEGAELNFRDRFRKFSKDHTISTETRGFTRDIVGMVGVPILQKYLTKQMSSKQLLAYDMIQNLSKEASTGNGGFDHVMDKQTKKHVSLETYIYKIFEQHQKDIGGPTLDTYRYEQELKDACKQIAQAMQKDMLDPKILLALVGERRILDGNMRVASSEVVEEELRHQAHVADRLQNVDPQQFVASTAYNTKEEFSAIQQALPEQERDFFLSLFPAPVLKRLTGMKYEEIEALKDRAADQFVAQAGQVIDALSQMQDAELQENDLSAREIKHLRTLAQKIQKSDPEKVLSALKGHELADLKETLMNARGYWQARVGEGQAEGSFVERVSNKAGSVVKEGFAAVTGRKGEEAGAASR